MSLRIKFSLRTIMGLVLAAAVITYALAELMRWNETHYVEARTTATAPAPLPSESGPLERQLFKVAEFKYANGGRLYCVERSYTYGWTWMTQDWGRVRVNGKVVRLKRGECQLWQADGSGAAKRVEINDSQRSFLQLLLSLRDPSQMESVWQSFLREEGPDKP